MHPAYHLNTLAGSGRLCSSYSGVVWSSNLPSA